MNSQLGPIDITNDPAMHRLVDQVRSARQPLPLQSRGRTVALLTPVDDTDTHTEDTPRVPAGRPLTQDDSLLCLIGPARSESATDVSENKHKYLAVAYASTHG